MAKSQNLLLYLRTFCTKILGVKNLVKGYKNEIRCGKRRFIKWYKNC